MRRASAIVLTLLLAALMAGTALAQETDTAEPDTVALAALTPEELFLRASSSALQFEHMREPSRHILVRDYGRSLPYLVTQLDTDDARERHALEDVLVRIGPAAAGPVIDGLVLEARRADTTRGARLAAAVLGKLGEASAVQPLASIHDHRDWKVRGAVAGALGRIGVGDAVAPLVLLLEDQDEAVRKSAAVGLKRVAIRATDPDSPDAETAGALDSDVVESLVQALGDSNYAVRYSASDALGRIGEPALIRLLRVVSNGSGEARLMALRSVGVVGSIAALEPLASTLEDPDWTVRAFAVSAMGSIGLDGDSRSAVERLANHDTHPFVIATATEALDQTDR